MVMQRDKVPEQRPVKRYSVRVYRTGLPSEVFTGQSVQWGVSDEQRLEVIHGTADDDDQTRTIYAPGAWTKIEERFER